MPFLRGADAGANARASDDSGNQLVMKITCEVVLIVKKMVQSTDL